MRHTFFRYRFIFFPLIAIGFIPLFSFFVMQLWNNILVDVINVKSIHFGQAIGILVLSKILFGGFGPGRMGGGGRWRKHRMEERLKHMSPEEREKFKSQLQNRFCPGGWNKAETDSTENTANQPM